MANAEEFCYVIGRGLHYTQQIFVHVMPMTAWHGNLTGQHWPASEADGCSKGRSGRSV